MTFDMQPMLDGPTLALRPLRHDDWDAVFAAASDPLIWELHPIADRYTEASFRPYFSERLSAGGTLVVIDRASGDVIGWSSYGNFDQLAGEVEIGWTFLVRSHWGGHANREMKALMLANAFRFVDTVTFRIGETNFRSQRAMEKIGGIWNGRMTTITVKGVAIIHRVYVIRKNTAAD
jgi:N-acetyltransferase